jgi:hypothetical protein
VCHLPTEEDVTPLSSNRFHVGKADVKGQKEKQLIRGTLISYKSIQYFCPVLNDSGRYVNLMGGGGGLLCSTVSPIVPSISVTKRRGQVASTLASCAGGPEFKYQPRDRVSWLKDSWFPSVPLRKCRNGTLKQVTIASFHILSNSLFINHPVIQHYIFWAANGVVEWTT